jgi:Zn-dependent protease with chaperone function
MNSGQLAFPYPPAPAHVPSAITELSGAYRLRSAAMLFSLFLFLLFYLAAIVGVAFLIWLMIQIPLESGSRTSGRGAAGLFIFKLGGIVALGLLIIFLIKGLFKGQRIDREQYLRIHEGDAPQLWAFIHQVCKDAGAPRPRHVYLSADVNAAVIFNSSLLNLFVPPRKDLLIGLGLVNVLTLNEFKAVLAHEFGHFAQKSAGMGSYLMLARRIMDDIVYSRDGWDRFVDQWASIDLRVSFPAWGLKAVLWTLRKVMGGALQGLGLLHLSLSRQLEYNADNVAVKLCGSDAIVHSLARLDFASEALADAARSLEAAADHGHYTDDLFFHQTTSAERLRALRKDPKLGIPPQLPEDASVKVQVFQPEHDGIPDHLRSHPTNLMREVNAKRIYVRSPVDDRSPWLLFQDRTALSKAVTEVFYLQQLNRKEYTAMPASVVQQFIDAEHAETTYDPKYHGFYDGRFVRPGELTSTAEPAYQLTPAALEATLGRWLGPDQESRLKAFQTRQGEAELLQGLESGQYSLKGKTFPFREVDRGIKDVPGLLSTVNGELEADVSYFHELDREVFLLHHALARHLDERIPREKPRVDELVERYRCHDLVQNLVKGMMEEEARFMNIMAYLQANQNNLERDAAQQILNDMHAILRTIKNNITTAHDHRLPALSNVPAGTTLGQLIMERDQEELDEITLQQLSGEWIGKLAGKLNAMLTRVKRVHFKSMGGLLQLQERLMQDGRPLVETSAAASAASAEVSPAKAEV